jgi:hypothetical protein
VLEQLLLRGVILQEEAQHVGVLKHAAAVDHLGREG